MGVSSGLVFTSTSFVDIGRDYDSGSRGYTSNLVNIFYSKVGEHVIVIVRCHLIGYCHLLVLMCKLAKGWNIES